MKLGLIQTKQNELYDFGNLDLRLSIEQVVELQNEMKNQTLELIREACKKKCDFIVTSEAINFCGPPNNIFCNYTEVIPSLEDSFFQEVAAIAKEEKKYIVLGAYNKREGKMFNSTLVYDTKGEQKYQYDKVHLAGSENDCLTAGKEYLVMDTKFGKIGIAICWDMQFPEVCRELVLGGADLIVCPTWGWEQIYGHARAYENGIYVASAMSVPFQDNIKGIRNPSEVVSPMGEILASGSRNKAEVVTCELDIRDCHDYKQLRISCRHPNTYKHISMNYDNNNV